MVKIYRQRGNQVDCEFISEFEISGFDTSSSSRKRLICVNDLTAVILSPNRDPLGFITLL